MYLSTVVQCARKVIIFRFGVPAEHHETEGPTDRVGIGFVADGGSAVAVPVRVGVGLRAGRVAVGPAVGRDFRRRKAEDTQRSPSATPPPLNNK